MSPVTCRMNSTTEMSDVILSMRVFRARSVISTSMIRQSGRRRSCLFRKLGDASDIRRKFCPNNGVHLTSLGLSLEGSSLQECSQSEPQRHILRQRMLILLGRVVQTVNTNRVVKADLGWMDTRRIPVADPIRDDDSHRFRFAISNGAAS